MASDDLSRADLERALSYVQRVHAASSPDSYRRAVLQITELIPGNWVSYNEIERGDGTALVVNEPPMSEEDLEPFYRYREQNPLLLRHFEEDDPGPVAISDLIDEEAWHATDVYRHFYAVFGIEDQLAMGLPAPPGQVIAVVINRARRGFSDKDRALLEMVRPHVLQSFRMTREAERSRAEIARLTSRIERSGPTPDLDRLAVEHGLSPRQLEVLRLLEQGRPTKAIAAELGISVGTAFKHVENIRAALGVHSRAELLVKLHSPPPGG